MGYGKSGVLQFGDIQWLACCTISSSGELLVPYLLYSFMFVSGACGGVVIDSSSCMYTNDESGLPFDRYVGNYRFPRDQFFTYLRSGFSTAN